jgi:hypothetical protein
VVSAKGILTIAGQAEGAMWVHRIDSAMQLPSDSTLVHASAANGWVFSISTTPTVMQFVQTSHRRPDAGDATSLEPDSW